MAKKAKGNRVQVILECTEHKDSGMPGTSRYITVGRRAAPHLHMGAFPGQADQAPVLVLQPAYGSRRCPGARGERQTGRREDPRNVRPQGVRDPHGRFQRRPEQPHLYDLHRLGGIGRFV